MFEPQEANTMFTSQIGAFVNSCVPGEEIRTHAGRGSSKWSGESSPAIKGHFAN